MEIINILAIFLAEQVKISQPAARGLLKLSIKDNFGPFKPLDELGFEDFKNVINTALKQRLIKLEVKNYAKVLKKLNRQLIKNQSLIAMTKV